MTKATKKVYLASPLGFNPENDFYRERVKDRLRILQCDVFDPWDQKEVAVAIKAAVALNDQLERTQAIQRVAYLTGQANAVAIINSDYVLAVLDGTEPDSGTVAELGFGAGIGKKCYGLRSDLRESGDLPGLPLNLQLLFFIGYSHGCLFRSVEDILL